MREIKIDDIFVGNALKNIGIDPKIYPDLINRYLESHRFYHSVHHVENLLHQIETIYSVYDDVSESDCEILAITAIFHDIVYDPKQTDNEEKSVEFFDSLLSPDKGNDKDINQIRHMILATKRHHKTGDRLTDLFNMMDMDILFADFPALVFYEYQIRQEYIFADDQMYKFGRLAFLNSIIKDPIYYSNIRNLLELRIYVERKYK